MSMFNVNIYIKNKTFIIHELHFGFFQTFEDSSLIFLKSTVNSLPYLLSFFMWRTRVVSAIISSLVREKMRHLVIAKNTISV